MEDQKDREAEEILKYYGSLRDKKEQAVIVEMLRELQEVFGCITGEMKERAAQTAGVDPSFIALLVKMYPGLRESVYRHELVVCLGGCCTKKGSPQMYQELKKKLGIGKDGVSRDGSICVRTRNCLKNCRCAPNILVDGQVEPGWKVDEIVDRVRK